MYKDRIDGMVQAYKNDKEVLDMIHDSLTSYTDYVDMVTNMEYAISVLRFRLEPEEYRERIGLMDRNRRICHNGIIAGTKMLNNFCRAKGIEPLFTGNIEDRIEVAEFAMDITKEMFKKRNK